MGYQDSIRRPDGSWNIGRSIAMIIGAVVMLTLLVASSQFVENVDADEILVVQDRADGELHWHKTAGLKAQVFGKTTTYPKRSIYEFEAPVQFNDGGKGIIYGSVQYDMSLDDENLTELHTRYGSAEAIQQQIIETVTNRVVYMTGPLMSSRESYAERRNYLISYAQDQIDHGVYRTQSVTKDMIDQFTGEAKKVTVAEIEIGEDGLPERQEQSVVGEFGIRAFNFSIEKIDYDDAIEQQIAQQQQLAMDVQTSVAEALKAQQAAITAEQQGRADAAKAKWEQEVDKAKAVTLAQQELEVQELKTRTANLYEQEQEARGRADGAYRRALMQADGALTQKLQVYREVNQMYADAIKGYAGAWVPSVMMGGGQGGGASTNSAFDLINMLTVQTARDLALDMRPTTGGGR